MSDSEGGELTRYIRERRGRLTIALAALAAATLLVVALLLATHVVELVIEPADAEAAVEQQRGVLVAVGHRVFLFSGEGGVTVSAEGFFPQEIPLARSTTEGRLPVRLDPRPGVVSLVVESTEEFLVRVDGRIVGAEPEIEVELAGGDYAVTVQGPGFAPIEEEIAVTGRGARQTFSFAPIAPALAPVEFRVSAEPQSAGISIDGAPVATGSYVGSLQPGVYEVTIGADDYQPVVRRVEVAAGAAATDLGTVVLAPLPAVVAFDSAPPGATVLVDGDFRGETPVRVEMAAGTNHRISIRKASFGQVEDSLQPAPNARIERFYDLNATAYRAEITANRPARIAVNGRVAGDAPLTVEVQDGDEIRALAAGFTARPVRVRPAGGAERRYAFRLVEDATFAYESAAALETAPAGIRLKRFAPVRFDVGRQPLDLSRPFYFAVHETTVEAFRAFKPDFAPDAAADQPAVSVTWREATDFCNWLSAEAGLAPAYVQGGAFPKLKPASTGYRLPTEAEWEAVVGYDFAAARVRGRPYPWGAAPSIPRAFANLAGRERRANGRFLSDHVDNHEGIAPVAAYPANFNGIHGLAGNVSEWVNDFYRAGPFAPQAAKDPLGPPTGTDHVVKGANHLTADRAELTAGHRTFTAHKSPTVGFRVARWIR